MHRGRGKYGSALITISVLFASGCANNVNTPSVVADEKNSFSTTIPFESNFHPNLKNWLDYYQVKDSTLSLDGFRLYVIDTIKFRAGNVFGSFHPEFDNVYLDFLSYNEDRTKYIDIDSYSWFVTTDSKAEFSPDQEINLLDVTEKSVLRIGFYGPSAKVEEAFWEGDSVVALLGNGEPDVSGIFIARLNLSTGVQRIYHHKGFPEIESDYTRKRLGEKGIKVN